MDCITFNMAGMHRHGTAFYDFLRLRKSYFVDQLGWDIPHDHEVEMDQYDNPQAWYVLALDDDGQVMGGLRAMAATARWGSHGIMLRDALDGRLSGIPPSVAEGVTFGGKVWEITRFVVSEELPTSSDRSHCMQLLSQGVTEVAMRHGATELVCLSLPPLRRALRSLGFPVEQRGRPYVCAEDRRQYEVMSMALRPQSRLGHAAPAGARAPAQRSQRAQPVMVHAPQKD